jgi:tetratricopeptide (TPR) repeat protein
MNFRMRTAAAILGCLVAAAPVIAQTGAKLAVGPEAGGYLCPDGRQVYVKSCYDNSPNARCGLVLMHLPAQNGFQRESTETRSQLAPSLAACKVYPLEFRNDGTVGLVLPKSPPPQQAVKAPAATPAPKPVAKPVPPPARVNAAEQAQLAFLEGERLSDEIGGDRDEAAQRMEAALAAYAKAAKLDPTLRTAWLRQGQIHFNRVDFDLAIPFYEKALELDQNDADTASELCTAYVLSDAPPEKGVLACQRDLKLNPKEAASAHQSIAQLQRRSGDNQKALASALEWARLEPEKRLPWETLTDIYMDLGRNADALAAVQKAVKLEPKDISILALRGDVYRRMGKFTESIADYRAALVLWPENPEVHHGLADTLRAAGRKTEADAELRLAIDHALGNGRNALKKPADGSPVSFNSIFAAEENLKLLEKWDKAAAAKLAAEIKAAKR